MRSFKRSSESNIEPRYFSFMPQGAKAKGHAWDPFGFLSVGAAGKRSGRSPTEPKELCLPCHSHGNSLTSSAFNLSILYPYSI